MSSFPSGLDAIAANKVNSTLPALPGHENTNEVGDHAGHHNLLAAATNAIEATLGLNPQNGFATVALAIAAALSLTKNGDLDVVSRVIRVGPVHYDASIPAGGPNSTYVVLDKNNTASDSSVYFRDQGLGRSEIGLATDNRLHVKAVVGAVAGSETFTDALIVETNAKVWVPISLGIGTIPVADLHIGFTRAATRVIAKFENVGNGGVAVELKTPGGDWGIVGDAAQNGGNNFGIMDFTAGYPPRLFISSTGQVAIGSDTPTQQLDVRGRIAVGGTTGSPGTAGAQIIAGTGTPASVVSAPVGSIFLRTDGGAATTLYVKESGAAGNTGWVAK